MSESSLEGLIAVDTEAYYGDRWISAFGSHRAYVADPHGGDGVYPNAIRVAWEGIENDQGIGFYFWQDASYQNGSFFKIDCSQSLAITIPDSIDPAARTVQGNARLRLGNVVAGTETIVVERYIDTYPAISKSSPVDFDIIETAGSLAGAAMFCVVKVGDEYVTSVFGPRFYNAFSFASPQFSSLPRVLTKNWTDSAVRPRVSKFIACSAVHNLGTHSLDLSPGQSSWVLSDLSESGLRKPQGPERNAGGMYHVAASASDQFIPSQRDQVEIASVGAYAGAGAKTIPWGGAGENRVSATLTIQLTQWPAGLTSEPFPTMITSPISGGISHSGVLNLGTRMFFANSAETSSVTVARPSHNAPPPTFVANPNSGCDPAWVDLPAYDDLENPPANRSLWESIVADQQIKRERINNFLQAVNSGQLPAPPLPASIFPGIVGANERTDSKVTWPQQQRFGFVDITPRFKPATVQHSPPLGYEGFTSEAVRAGGFPATRIYVAKAGGASTRNVSISPPVLTWKQRTHYQRWKKHTFVGQVTAVSGFSGTLSQGTPIRDKNGRDQWTEESMRLDDGSAAGQEESRSQPEPEFDIELSVPEIPLASVRQLLANGTTTFSSSCTIRYYESSFGPYSTITWPYLRPVLAATVTGTANVTITLS